MLVLSRKSRESVVVGGPNDLEGVLKITVLEIRSREVRLGFEVNADVPVHRLEVWERIRASGRPKAGRVAGRTEGPRLPSERVHDGAMSQ